ncbi:hypothetical protein ARALYDRAFT_343019 [Arabidopsis lyrata subsp. lyrata]|uniref:RNase H type-1 domain-containing protein n=1 Tax=Arabidopsis lyrata subsp. lyrata TaxID=81972 RepID=D7L040_ARALL|nr:hypothetical protein ARALYDRAFT_343019 [Arabidopsis lyrata subsp. lyrata]
MDLRLWKDAYQASNDSINNSQDRQQPTVSTTQPVISLTTPFYCCTDGSWINSDSNAGIGWSLHDIHGRCIIKSYSSVEPTSSVLETEAIALRQALFQLKRLNYRQVTFCGDSATLYHYLEKAAKQSHPPPGNKEIQRYIDDILGLSNGAYLFKFIPRSANSLADSLAKEARLKKSPLVVSWTC